MSPTPNRRLAERETGVPDSTQRVWQTRGWIPRDSEVGLDVYIASLQIRKSQRDRMSAREIDQERALFREGEMLKDFKLFIPITKIDEERRLLYGTITEEALDKSGEVFDYASSKPYYQAWSDEISKATDGKSKGNLRVMHTDKVAGKLTELMFDDEAKRVSCVAKVVDDDEWKMCLEGGYTGFSQGGRYVNRWEDGDGAMRFTVRPIETSLVDNPCLSTARFSLLKSNGSVEERGFRSAKPLTKDERLKLEFFEREEALRKSGPSNARNKKQSAAEELLSKSAELGGLAKLATAALLHPDLVSKLKTEPVPTVDLLPSERASLMSLKSGMPMHEVLKADFSLRVEYEQEMQGLHPVQAARAEQTRKASQEAYSLRKSATASGPIPLEEVTVRARGTRVTKQEDREAYVFLARQRHPMARGVVFEARGATIAAEDIAVKK